MKCFADALLVLLLAVADLGILAPVTQGPTNMTSPQTEPLTHGPTKKTTPKARPKTKGPTSMTTSEGTMKTTTPPAHPIVYELKDDYLILAQPKKDLEPSKMPTPDPKPEIYVLNNRVNCCYPHYENFNCSRVKDYFITNIGCPHSVILFQTQEDSYICADAKDRSIRYCLVSLVVRHQALQALSRLEPLGLDRILEFWHGS